jgi:translation initiation factor 2 subunit 2
MAEERYTELLDKALSQLPSDVAQKERFELTEPSSSIMGNRTILYNLKEICDRLRREREHLLTYLSKELATAGSLDGTSAVFQGRFNNATIKRLIERYAQEFVFCEVCNKPDTRLVKDGRYTFLVCDACGAKSSVKRNL